MYNIRDTKQGGFLGIIPTDYEFIGQLIPFEFKTKRKAKNFLRARNIDNRNKRFIFIKGEK